MVGAALSFLDGRSLTVFEAASKGSRQTVQDNPDLYKRLLVRSPLKLLLLWSVWFFRFFCDVYQKYSTQTAGQTTAGFRCCQVA